ncbi:hypothetical protein ACHAWF_011667 [Thalassiosira exigua]
MAWKSRAESVLSQFVDGSVGGPGGGDGGGFGDLYSYPQHENSSHPPPAGSCAALGYDSVYDRLLGCGCGAGAHDAVGGGPCASLLLQWARLVLGGTIRAYLSSPLCLALLPLAVGLGVGFWMGRRGRSDSASNIVRSGKIKDTWASRLLSWASRCYHWLAMHSMLMLLCLDRRRLCRGDSALIDDERDNRTRAELQETESKRESGVDPRLVPRHIAVIMDGNRRHGRAKYGSAARGHWDGSRTLMEFSKWCMAEGVEVLTVYAFSTENWDRDPAEVAALMSIFRKYCDELRVEAVERGIRVRVLSTEQSRIPEDVREGLDRMVEETRDGDRFEMNICLSYGGRGEIVNACRSIAADVRAGRLDAEGVGEAEVRDRLLTGCCRDPDVVIRTSGEERLSNFLLWQVAYSEFFFLKKHWPELEKEDLFEVIRSFAHGRKRRFGK